MREYEYRSVLNFLKFNFNEHDILVVETGKYEGSFLESYGFRVIYSGIPNSYKNKGCNEAQMLLSIKDKIKSKKVVKLTGRYLPISTKFFDKLDANSEFDILCRLSSNKLWAGCFASDSNILFEKLKQLDLNAMEKNWICIEDALWELYLPYKKILVDDIGIMARIGNSNKVSFM